MPAIVLQNRDSELLGFLLVAGTEPLGGGQNRDCVFTGVPRRVELFDDPLGAFIQENKNVEFSITARHIGALMEARVPIRDGVEIVLQLQDDGSGEWTLRRGQESLSGRCTLTSKKDV